MKTVEAYENAILLSGLLDEESIEVTVLDLKRLLAVAHTANNYVKFRIAVTGFDATYPYPVQMALNELNSSTGETQSARLKAIENVDLVRKMLGLPPLRDKD